MRGPPACTCTRPWGLPRARRGMPALPSCHTTLEATIPKHGYPKQLNHLGDHLLKRRLDLGLTRKAAAAQMGLDPESLENWEKGRTPPAVRFFPKLIELLGYNPLPEPRTRGEAIARERTSRGFSRKALAEVVGVDEATVRRLEIDRPRTAIRPMKMVCQFLGVSATDP